MILAWHNGRPPHPALSPGYGGEGKREGVACVGRVNRIRSFLLARGILAKSVLQGVVEELGVNGACNIVPQVLGRVAGVKGVGVMGCCDSNGVGGGVEMLQTDAK